MLKKIIIALCVFNLSQVYANYQDYLKAHWDFETIVNQKLVDLSGKDNNGSFFPTNTIPLRVDGIIGNCLQFDGNYYVKLDNERFMDGECNLTMTCWFKIEGESANTYQLFCISGTEPWKDPITFQFANKKPSDFAFENCNDSTAIRSKRNSFRFSIERNEWYFLTVVLCSDSETSIMKLYLNGELAETVSERSKMYPPMESIGPGRLCPTYHQDSNMIATIGALVYYPAWNWRGCIDEMKFFSTCLTDSDIMQEYNSGNCGSSKYEY